MKFSSALLTAAVLSTTTQTIPLFAVAAAELPSFQSGPNSGAVYAAQLAVAADGGTVYITGITYDPSFGNANANASQAAATPVSSCFVTALSYSTDQPTLTQGLTSVYGAADGKIDACRGMALLSTQQLVVVGNSDPGGLYAPPETTSAVQVGFGMTVSRQDLTAISGDSLYDQTATSIPYPQAIVVNPNDADSIYVASMVSNSNRGSTVTNDQGEEYPNWTHQFQHGTTFEMMVELLQYTTQGAGNTFHGILDGMQDPTKQSPPKLQSKWKHQFGLQAAPGSTTTPSAYVGGMIWKPNVGLIVAGSTAGLGIGYGPAECSDEDGFITLLDPATGELAAGRKNNQRFGTAQYDVVTSICDDPNDPTAFYIVGATQGDMNGIQPNDIQVPSGSLQAFIQKVNVDSLYGDWTVQNAAQLGNTTATTATTALGCIAYKDVVYVAGVVSGGAGMIQGQQVHRSSGGDDIWVAQYSTTDGTVQWMQQIGSSGDDHVARNGGIGIDASGNAIVVGDTTGALYRDRSVSASTDLFAVTLDYTNGNYATTVGGDSPNDPTVESILAVDPANDIQNTVASSTAVVPSSAQAHQSGPNNGALYAASIAYDAVSDQAVLVGISYINQQGEMIDQPNCIVARMDISSMETKDFTIFGTPGILEACRDVALTGTPGTTPLGQSNIVVVGNSEHGGMYADGAQTKVQAGFGMTLNGQDLARDKGASLFSNTIPYPQSVIVDGTTDVYVASMNSNDELQNANAQIGSEFPNWTYRNKFGKAFTMTVEKLSLPDMQSVWSQNYPVQPEADGTVNSVYVGGLILKNGNTLVTVGSTRAKGEAYGPAEGDDADGYITLLDPSNGNLMPVVNNTIRIGSAADDVLTAICDVPGDTESVVVIGATKGDVGGIRVASTTIPDGSLQWFAKKINLSTLTATWTIQGGAIFTDANMALPTSSFAVGCHVNNNGAVYVGGTVENGAQLLDGSGNPLAAIGGDDVWVAQLDLSDGNINWIVQLGSPGDDELGRNGGITTDKNGNALIFGDTTGAFYRDRTVGSNADIFLAVLNSSDGSFSAKGTAAPGSGPNADNIPKMQPTPAPVAPPTQKDSHTSSGQAIPEDIVALQLGPDVGPSYAGGMDYDPNTNAVYLTGATYGTFSGPGARASKRSTCFFARIDMPELEVIQRDTYGVDMVADACTAIATNDFDDQRNVIALGMTQPGGLLTDLTYNKSLQYGYALDLTLQHKYEFLGGSVVGSGAVTYPVALYVDNGQFWTLSVTSTGTMVSADYSKIKHSSFPDFTSGGVRQYGNYQMTVESFKMDRAGDGNPFAQGAVKTFASQNQQQVDLPIAHEGMFVNGMTAVGNDLVVVGSVYHNGNVDGFMAKVSRSSGNLTQVGSSSFQLYRAGSESDDWIMNVCADPNNSEFFYIVGASSDKNTKKSGRGETVHAIISQIEAKTLRTSWEKRMDATRQSGRRKKNLAASAYGCDLVPIDNILYVGGTVYDGAVMTDVLKGRTPSRSAGGDDIFVASISSLDGQLTWIKQVGSNGNDRLAGSGGVKTDVNGNVIAFGDTTGDFFRFRKGSDAKYRYNDLFVMAFDKNYGIHQPPLNGPKIRDNSVVSPFFNNFAQTGKNGWRIVGFVVLALAILGVFCCCCRRGRCRRRGCCKRKKKESPSLYDAAAADLGFDDPTSLNSGRGLSMGLFRDKPEDNSLSGGPNLNYRDDVEDSGDLVGNFHKTYSDLPQNGKEII